MNAVFPLSILRWASCQRLCIHSLARTFWKGWVGAHSHFVDEGEIQELASGGPHPWRPLSFLPGSGTWGWTISRRELGWPPAASRDLTSSLHPFALQYRGTGVGGGAVSSPKGNLAGKGQR